MSLFAPSAEIEVRQALAANRTVFLIAPRRSGLTHWAQGMFQGGIGSAREVRFIESSSAQTLPTFLAHLRGALGVSTNLREPNDLPAACATTTPRDIVICSAHRLCRSVLEWLLRALLDRVGGSDDIQVRFLVEGSVDIDAILLELFPQGTGENPFVLWSEPAPPWVLMGQLERLIAARPRRYPVALMPWVVDHTGGDVGLIAEFLERLPPAGAIDERTIEATWLNVEKRGPVSHEIRALATQCDDEVLLRRLSSGVVVQDIAPPSMENQTVRFLYLGGAIAYDPMSQAYAVRSPAVARILSAWLDDTTLSLSVSRAAVHARTSFLIWRVAAVELQLRALLVGQDWTAKARDAKCDTPWSGKSKEIRAEANAEGFDANKLAALSRIMNRLLPDKVSVLDETRRRAGSECDTPEALADRLNFSEVALLARALQVVHERFQTPLEGINRRRNDLAHFRSIAFDDAMELIRLLDEVQAALVSAVPTQSG